MVQSTEEQAIDVLATRLLDAIMFEQWIRFSWIAEDADGDFCIQVPAETVAQLAEDYPEYIPLLERLNGTIVDPSMACSAILAFATETMGQEALATLEQQAFQEQVARFHVWLHDAADSLNEHDYNFDQWKIMFGAALAEGACDAPHTLQ